MPSPKLFSIIAAVVVFFGLTVYISLISGYFLSKYNNSTNTLRDVTDSFGLTDHELMNGVESIYIIPGGGSSNKGAYPEWTQRRVTTAFDYYLDSGDSQQNKTLFVSLSAGSLNAPNSQLSPPNDPRIVFECQHVMNHLKRLGVRKEIIFGDTFSWDTVTNALTLRTLVESLIQLQLESTETVLYHGVRVPVKRTDHFQHNPLVLHVFISEFHSERVEAAFRWVLGLSPSVLPSVTLVMHNISSSGILGLSSEDLDIRAQHERIGVERIQANAIQIRTLAQFHAFLLLGGHKGLQSYLHAEYTPSAGGGW